MGSLPDFPRKPAPNGVLRVLTALGADADSAVYIGDSDVDVATAKNAGLFSIGVTWGYRDKAVLADAVRIVLLIHPKNCSLYFSKNINKKKWSKFFYDCASYRKTESLPKNIDIWCISSVAERRRESNGCFILVTMVFA